MRMRKKKWAEPELAACPYFIADSESCRGRWKEQFPRQQPLWLELGCGKGGFLSQYALACPGVNFLGVDLISDMLGVARRKIQAAFDSAGRTVDNLRLTSFDITRMELSMGEGDRVERIFINFCNPWFRPKQFKKRLTHPRQLLKYREILAPEGEIWFKTDSDMLFEHSLRYFAGMGFEVLFQTEDLHGSGFSPNPLTEHEEMYAAEGILIKFARVRKKELDGGAAGGAAGAPAPAPPECPPGGPPSFPPGKEGGKKGSQGAPPPPDTPAR